VVCGKPCEGNVAGVGKATLKEVPGRLARN
jgi:hypothetical protein